MLYVFLIKNHQGVPYRTVNVKFCLQNRRPYPKGLHYPLLKLMSGTRAKVVIEYISLPNLKDSRDTKAEKFLRVSCLPQREKKDRSFRIPVVTTLERPDLNKDLENSSNTMGP